MNNNNSLDNVNSLNNLRNIEISNNKQNIVFYCISQLFYQNYSNVFVILDYEITFTARFIYLHRTILKLRSLAEMINH